MQDSSSISAAAIVSQAVRRSARPQMRPRPLRPRPVLPPGPAALPQLDRLQISISTQYLI